MKWFPLALAIAALAAAGLAPATNAQGEAALSIRPTWAPKSDDSVLDSHGRLPASTAYRTFYSFTVDFPPVVGQCPLGTVTVLWSVVAKPTYATVILSPASVTKNAQSQLPSTQNSIPGFDTTLTIVTAENAPHHDAGEYRISAQAFPSGGTAQGCIARQSYPLIMSEIVVTA